MQIIADKKKSIKEYYGRILNGTKDLKTGACCSGYESLPDHAREILEDIDDGILSRYYGCGSPIPPVLEGQTVLDLGCGTGRDVYIASRLVGPQGKVIGVDMTEEQIAIAEKHLESQMNVFGYKNPNVEFKLGFIEDLKEVGIESDSIDVVISNCVINLSPDKPSVFKEVFRVLKPGGELFFSDIFAGRRIPDHLEADPVLKGECLSGAMYIEDFRRLLRVQGCLDYRIATTCPVSIDNPEIMEKIGMVDFYSMTIRVFKLDDLEDVCEDYGQVATYLGTIPGYPHGFALDNHHVFMSGKPVPVCGNTASMLKKSRLKSHFRVIGDRSVHYGIFDCSPEQSKIKGERDGGACC